jgi:hypothetical protein
MPNGEGTQPLKGFQKCKFEFQINRPLAVFSLLPFPIIFNFTTLSLVPLNIVTL